MTRLLPILDAPPEDGSLTSRSQAILRMPVDMLSATVILHDGERFEAMLFVPTGDGVIRLLGECEPFVPVVKKGRTCLVARTAIAALGLPKAPTDLEALPLEEQKVQVKLRSGVQLDGQITWCADGQRHRTKDHLNSSDLYFELHTDDVTYYVVKAQVATVQEC